MIQIWGLITISRRTKFINLDAPKLEKKIELGVKMRIYSMKCILF